MAWQEVVDDLRLKHLNDRLGELYRLQQVYVALNPGERKHWQEIVDKLSKADGPAERNLFIDQILESDYYKSIRCDLDQVDFALRALKNLKSMKFCRS